MGSNPFLRQIFINYLHQGKLRNRDGLIFCGGSVFRPIDSRDIDCKSIGVKVAIIPKGLNYRLPGGSKVFSCTVEETVM